MKIADWLNQRFEHPSTIVFDDAAMFQIGMILVFLLMGIFGFLFFWPMGVIGIVTAGIFIYLAWKDFGHLLLEVKRRNRLRSREASRKLINCPKGCRSTDRPYDAPLRAFLFIVRAFVHQKWSSL